MLLKNKDIVSIKLINLYKILSILGINKLIIDIGNIINILYIFNIKLKIKLIILIQILIK